jgi:two-component system cell cycle response regulator
MNKARILVADEDEVLAGTLAWLLKEQGFDVVVTTSGERLIEQFETMLPDLLVIDIRLQGTDRYDLLERVSADRRWRDMPVLVISALDPDEATARLLSVGATDFIGKPFHVRELLARIRVLLRMRQELLQARSALHSTEVELKRVRDEAESRRQLVDILHEVTGDFSSEELYHILVRRVARALNISHCSLILARPGDSVGVVATAYETPDLSHLEIRLERYPEIRAALELGQPVLVEDVDTSPLYNDARLDWAASGTIVPFRSVIALPFQLDRQSGGVVLLCTLRGEQPLGRGDVEFADTVVRAAVSAIRRAQTIESTKADKARLEMLARTDPLTQLHNRRSLMDRLSEEVERVRRYGLTLSALMVDIDHFKAVNDTYGHLVGDEVLRGVARVLQREARAVDVVARYGGEEFVLVLPETAVAERIRQRIAEQPLRGEQADRVRVTVSIGTATMPSPRAHSPESLIAAADEALYRAKAQGRNRVRT